MPVERTDGIVLVCAANVCRSPLAELVFRAAIDSLPESGSISISSGGISTTAEAVCQLVVERREDESWQQLAKSHKPARLDVAAAEEARLVLTASRGVRAAVVAAVPTARRKTFTLLEALWLSDGLAADTALPLPERLARFAAEIDSRRGIRPVAHERSSFVARLRRPAQAGSARHSLDVRDGHNLGLAMHRSTLDLVESSAEQLAKSCFGES